MLIHEETDRELLTMLKMLAERGEDETFAWIRDVYLKQPEEKPIPSAEEPPLFP